MIERRNLVQVLSFIFILAVVFFVQPQIIEAMESTGIFEVRVDSKLVNFNDDMGYPYLTKEARTMVPLRIISENMGYDVTWDQGSKTATIKNGKDTVKVTIGQNFAMKNGQKVFMDIQDGKPVDTKAVLTNSRTYVPIRFISEAMGATVGYNRLQVGSKITHQISITTGMVIPPVSGTDPTFDPVKDVLPDGRLTKEKTTEYIEKMIEGTTLRKEGGRYFLEFNRPAIAEGYLTGVGFNALTFSGKGGYALSSGKALYPENQLPLNQSFVKELDASRLTDVNFYKFSLSVAKPGGGVSTAYYIWYYPSDGFTEYMYTNEYGHQVEYKSFDKNRLFKGL